MKEEKDVSLLELRGIDAGYGGSIVVRGLDLAVRPGELVALLGANGAGKTTTLNVIAGLHRPDAGHVVLKGEDLAGRSAVARARAGVAFVPDTRGLFFGLTVAEHFRFSAPGENLRAETAFEYFPELRRLEERRAGLLSGGEQQMLAVGRALARSPQLLLLDELSFGLAPVIVERILPIIRDYTRSSGAGVLLVEQHVELAVDVADRCYVLAHGEMVMESSAERLREDRELVLSSYLGTSLKGPDEGSKK